MQPGWIQRCRLFILIIVVVLAYPTQAGSNILIVRAQGDEPGIPGSSAAPFNSSSLRYQVEIIFQHNLLSFYFEDKVKDIATTYTKGTDYEGRLNINRPPLRDYLNLYVFYYSRALPSYLKYNCTTSWKEQIILCDEALLDSILETMPVVYDQGDGVQYPFLMNWVIGHEIGHAVLKHDPSQYLNFSLAVANESHEQAQETSVEKWTKDFYAGNRTEQEADQFAIDGLNIGPSARSTWLQYGNNLADTIFWEAGDSEGGPIIVNFDPKQHPPMFLRTLHLFYKLREEYIDFQDYPDFFTSFQNIELHKGPITRGDMFFGGFYLGSDFPPDVNRRYVIDRALSLWVHGEREYASLFADAICTDGNSTQLDPAYGDLLNMFCTEFLVGYSTDTIDSHPASDIAHCDSVEVGSAGLCVGLLMLQGAICHTHALEVLPSQQDFCLSKERYKTIYLKYDGNVQFETWSGMLDWLVPLEYLFRSEVVNNSPDKLDSFVYNALLTAIEQNEGQIGRQLLVSHIAQLQTQDNDERLIFFQQALWNLYSLTGDRLSRKELDGEIGRLLDGTSAVNRDLIRYNYVTAINEGLQIFLAADNCEVPVDVLSQAEKVALAFDLDQDLKGVLMDNIAYAHLCAKTGNPRSALQFADAALHITNEQGQVNKDDYLERLYVLTFAYLKAGEYVLAQSKAFEFVKLYREQTSREFDTANSMKVSGVEVTLDKILSVSEPANLVQEIIDSLKIQIERGDNDFVAQQINQALNIPGPSLSLPAETWNALCWWGALYGRASDVVGGACERAVVLASKDLLAGHRESRGVARALTNDVDGALEDFRFFVDNWEGRESAEREDWIKRLGAGESPKAIFNAETIEMLRHE